jgi:hypothetical protein
MWQVCLRNQYGGIMKKVYIAGKLSHDDAVGYIKNCNKMILTAKLVRDNGYAVYVPCNDFLEGIVDGNFDYKDYFDNSQPWLKAADAVYLVPGWETSPGTKREMALADSINIPIFDDIHDMNKHFGK